MRSKLRSHTALLLFAAAGLVFAGQGVSLFWGVKTLGKAKSQLAAKERQRASLTNSEPAPTQAMAETLAREFDELRAAIAVAESLWHGNPIAHALSDFPPPPNSRAAYFDLVRYRQGFADLAGAQGVELGQDEFFGFRTYANEGPEEADILNVYTQRLVLERVLEPLLRSRPQRLLAVIRDEQQPFSEMPAPREVEAVRTRYRFQIRFLGTTAVLRTWLNELANAQLPVLVRSVAVEPGGERQIVPSRSRHNAGAEDGFELLVRPSRSEFFVILDYVELGAKKEPEAAPGGVPRFPKPSPKRIVTWPEPEPQRRGSQWVFDVFTPPEIFYHPARQQFRVKAVLPSSESAVAINLSAKDESERRSTLRLLGVRREDYPLKLSGYIGDSETEAFSGLFENRVNGETLLLRGGERVESLGIEVLDFQVEARLLADSEMATLRELRAVATIRDAKGERRTLYEGERAEGHALIAQVEWSDGIAELREGDLLMSEDGRQLTVAEIQSEPAPRVVMRLHVAADESDNSLAAESEPLVLVVESPPVDSAH